MQFSIVFALNPGDLGCQYSSDCTPNPGGESHCCLPSTMCASTGGGPYCYSYEYQTPYSYEYPSPYGYEYQYQYEYQTPYGYPYPTPPVMSGTLTPAIQSCVINAGSSSCTINFSWNTINPIATSAVTKPVNVTVATGNSGSTIPFSVKYNTETFYLYNNAVLLAQSTVSSSCISGSVWNGSICGAVVNGNWSGWSSWGSCSVSACGQTGTHNRTRACNNPIPQNGGANCVGSSIETEDCSTPACTVSNINVNPAIISTGQSSTLSWSSVSATSCTGTNFSTGGATAGSVVVKPNSTTTYTINCNGISSSSGSAKLTVRKKPIFIEN